MRMKKDEMLDKIEKRMMEIKFLMEKELEEKEQSRKEKERDLRRITAESIVKKKTILESFYKALIEEAVLETTSINDIKRKFEKFYSPFFEIQKGKEEKSLYEWIEKETHEKLKNAELKDETIRKYFNKNILLKEERLEYITGLKNGKIENKTLITQEELKEIKKDFKEISVALLKSLQDKDGTSYYEALEIILKLIKKGFVEIFNRKIEHENKQREKIDSLHLLLTRSSIKRKIPDKNLQEKIFKEIKEWYKTYQKDQKIYQMMFLSSKGLIYYNQLNYLLPEEEKVNWEVYFEQELAKELENLKKVSHIQEYSNLKNLKEKVLLLKE